MKVLLVEDNRGDARLIQEMLRKGGARFELTHVIRLSKALQRLGEEAFDVILLDLGLPDSQGVDTFDKIHAQAPDAPVVVLSGTDNEALAIETVQHGAQDYLVKGEVDRNPLVRSIRYAIERKRVEKRLANEEILQDFLDNANDLIQSVAPDGRLLFVNRAWRETLGYTEEEAAKLSIFDVVHPDSLEHCMGVFQRVMSGEEVNRVEAEFVAKDGRTIAVEGNVNCRFEGSKPVATRGIFRDVTERKTANNKVMERMKELQAFYNLSKVIEEEDVPEKLFQKFANILPQSWQYTEIAFCRIVIGDSEFHSKNFAESAWMQSAPVKVHGSVAGRIDVGYLEERPAEYEGPFLKEERLLIDALAERIGHITERKRAEEALRSSEGKLRAMFDAITDGIVTIDMEGHVLDLNEAAFRMPGYSSREELLGANAFDFVSEKDRERVANDIMKSISEGTALSNIEYTVMKKDGSTFDCDLSAAMLKDDSDNPVGFIAVERDVTERKWMEESLRASEEKLRLTFETIGDGITITDMEGRIVSVNAAMCRMGGWDREEVIGKQGFDFIAEQDREEALRSMLKVFGEGSSIVTEYSLLKKDGQEYPVEASAVILRNASGDAVGLISVARDVTERKRMEEALRDSEERLRTFIENAPDAIYIFDLMGNLIDGNRSAEELVGYSKEELVGKNFLDIGILPEEYALDAVGLLEQSRGGEMVQPVAIELIKKDGSRIAVETTSFPVKTRGKIEVLGIARDVTERKRTEEALRASEEELRITFASISDAIIITDEQGAIIDANDASYQISGYSRRELIGRNTLELIRRKDHETLVNLMLKNIEEKSGLSNFAVGFIKKDGSEIEAEFSSTPMSNADGELTGFTTVARDITERKRMEEALRASEEKLRFMFDSTSDGIVVTDLKGVIVNANEALTKIAGFNRKEELIGRDGFGLLVEGDGLKASKDTARANEYGRGGTREYTLLRNGGGMLNVEVSADLLKDASGESVGIICVVRDVTERKQAEETIRRRNRELQAINAIARLLSRPMRMDKMLQAALSSALDIVDISSGGIWLVGEARGVLIPAVYQGVSPKLKKSSAVVEMGEGVTGQAAMTGEVVLAPDFLRNSEPAHSHPSSARMQGLQSIIGVPLKAKGKTLGVMTLFERGCRHFSPCDIQLLETIGGEIGVAIENAQLLEKLNELSVTDELTGLYNRRHFYEVLDNEAARTQRYGHPFSLVIIDLDGFKQYNDTFGHVSGDVALEDFANAINLTLRKTDVAFRHGGDEFAIILPSTDAVKASKVIQRLRTRWEQVSEIRYRTLKTPLGFSAGIAQFPDDAETADSLLTVADATLYYAKEAGRYRTELASR